MARKRSLKFGNSSFISQELINVSSSLSEPDVVANEFVSILFHCYSCFFICHENEFSQRNDLDSMEPRLFWP